MLHAFYNEIDPYAAAWLRNLIGAGVIAPGVVDERDIRDIDPFELGQFTQCHFFAGIGVWSYALRNAGWSDDRPVWTGSCPCQPFSAAGRGVGFADERHLWPAFHHLIEVGKPPVVFGEQVASKDGLAWLDVVHTDMEAAGYAFGAFDLCAAGVGAPHIRQRIFFGAMALDNAPSARLAQERRWQQEKSERWSGGPELGCSRVRVADSAARGRRKGVEDVDAGRVESDDARCGVDGRMAHSDGFDAGAEWEQRGGEQRLQPANGGTRRLADSESVGLQRRQDDVDGRRRERAFGQGRPIGELEHPARDGRLERGTEPSGRGATGGRGVVELGDADGERLEGRPGQCVGSEGREITERPRGFPSGDVRPGPTNGFWRDADWLGCTDGKWRPVESSTFPLVDGSAFRVGSDSPFAGKSRAKMLRGYGNAIVAPLAEEFIKAAMEYLP